MKIITTFIPPSEGEVKVCGYDIITDSMDENLRLSSRNLPNVMVVDVNHADPVSLIRHSNVLITKGAVGKIEELLA